MANIDAVTKIVEPVIKDMGFELVRVKMIGGDDEPTLQIMAERPDTHQLTIEDCTKLSHALDEPLEEADPIDHAYRLEVSSPGIDRPLTRFQDYEDWKGHLARITLTEKRDGRRKYKAYLDGTDPEAGVVKLIDDADEFYIIPFDAIEDAKLIFTEKLLQETQPLSTEGAEDIEEDE